MTDPQRAIVIGAGPAGLAAAATLQRAGVPAIVLEREAIGASWRQHYNRLHLHTHRRLSGLPGLRFARSRGPWVARGDVVEYLEAYARHHSLDVRTGVEARRIDRHKEGWRVETSSEPFKARVVVVATGYNRVPWIPDWPGRDGFDGSILHASEYRTGSAFAGRDVLVVGSGNTGAEIAVDLVECGASRVRIAVRTPPHVLRRAVCGLPSQATGILLHRLPTRLTDPIAVGVQRLTVGDLTRYGLPSPRRGLFSDFRARHVVPILDVGFVDALKHGHLEVVPAVIGFDRPQVLLADGSAIAVDTVIAATGYRRGLERLVGHLDVLKPDGCPRASGGSTIPGAEGLHFVGYRSPLSGMFREMGFEARRVARAVTETRATRTRRPRRSRGHQPASPREGFVPS